MLHYISPFIDFWGVFAYGLDNTPLNTGEGEDAKNNEEDAILYSKEDKQASQ